MRLVAKKAGETEDGLGRRPRKSSNDWKSADAVQTKTEASWAGGKS